MNQPPNINAAVPDSPLNPAEAAALLDATTRQARRKFEPYPAWMLVFRAFLGLAGYGAAWLSVRGQHPYRYPTAAVIPVVVALGLLNLGATVLVARRATTGVTRRTRLRPAEIFVQVIIWVGVFVAIIPMALNGVSDSVVYGVYPVAAPLIAAGLTWAVTMAARAQWRKCGTALAVAVVGTAAVFAGPAGAWAVAGVGLCIALLGSAAALTWQQRG
jgi:hypothetical protein